MKVVTLVRMGRGILLPLFLALQGCKGVSDVPPPSGPNILVILVDDLRWDALGVVGHPFSRTPSIDRLAREGARFTNAFVTTSLCSPSRATLLTGLYAHAHGVVDNETRLPRSTPTLFEVFRRAGYRTGFIGKWHMGNGTGRPARKVDRWVSFAGQGVYLEPVVNIDGTDVQLHGHMTDILTDFAVDFLQQPRSVPFLLIVSHKAIHAPFTPQERFQGLYDGVQIELPPSFDEDLSQKPAFVAARGVGPDRGRMTRLIRDYYAALAGVDEGVGRLTGALEAQGILDSTVVIFTSDNGYFLGEHNLDDKRLAYEESIRVPLIVRYPPWFVAGTIVDGLVANIDLAPTILAAAGFPIDGPLAGVSLQAFAAGTVHRDAFLYEYFRDPNFPVTPPIRAIRTSRYMYVEYLDDPAPLELYDLQNDPAEVTNLAASAAHEALRDSLSSSLSALRRETGDVWQRPPRRAPASPR